MNKKKILYINHSSFFGGSEASLLDIIMYLNKNNYEPVVINPKNPMLLQNLKKLNVKTIIFDKKLLSYESLSRYVNNHSKNKSIFAMIYFTIKWVAKIIFNIFGGLQLFFLIKKIDPHLVHANNWLSAQYISPFIRYLEIPSIFHLRDFDEKRLNRLMDPIIIKLLSKFDKAIATSQAGCRFLKKMKRFPLDKMQLIHNGVDTSFFNKSTYHLEYSQKFSRELVDDLRNHFVFTQIGQICKGKGQKYFIEAAEEVTKAMPNALFLIAGEDFEGKGKNTQDLISLIKNKKLKDKVKLIGYHEDIRAILIHSDIIVAPSLEEAFGRTAAEAMAMGKPVIASDVDGLREIIVDDISGILVEPADHKRLASVMVDLAKDRNKMQMLGYNARKRIEQNFNISMQVKEIEKLYSDLLNNQKAT